MENVDMDQLFFFLTPPDPFLDPARFFGALGRVELRRIVLKLRRLRAHRSKCCDGHWDEVQLLLPYQMGVIGHLLLLFGCRRFFGLGHTQPKARCQWVVIVTSTATGSADVHLSMKISPGRFRPAIWASFVARKPAAATKAVQHSTMIWCRL